MEIRRKTESEIQAEIESYAEDNLDSLLLDFSSYLVSLDIDNWNNINLSDLLETDGFHESVKRRFNRVKKEKNSSVNFSDLEDYKDEIKENLFEIIKNRRSDFVSFLRKGYKDDPDSFQEDLDFLKQNIERYNNKFKEEVEKLKKKIEKKCEDIYDPCKTIDSYLGSGNYGSVYKIKVDGEKYAVKIEAAEYTLKFGIKAMRKADEEDIDRVSRMKAYSFEDNITVMGLVPGKNLSEYSEEDFNSYVSDDQIIDLLKTIEELSEANLSIDPNAGNIMFSKEKGFCIIDYDYYGKDSEINLIREIERLRASARSISISGRKFANRIAEKWNNSDFSGEDDVKLKKYKLNSLIREK